jgi:hypothetical protein
MAGQFFEILFSKYAWRDGRVAECGGLENRYPEGSGSWVRIPLSPPYFAKASYGTASFLNEQISSFLIIKKNHLSFT